LEEETFVGFFGVRTKKHGGRNISHHSLGEEEAWGKKQSTSFHMILWGKKNGGRNISHRFT